MYLKEIRLAKMLTQKAVANYIGCSSVVYSRYETGDREPSIDMLISIADCFEMTLDDIVGRKAAAVSKLSTYEIALLTASRNADERARQDALNMLVSHTTKNREGNLT